MAAVRPGSLDELAGARVDLLHGQIAFGSWPKGRRRAAAQCSCAARGVRLGLARETYLEAWAAALFAGRFARGSGVLAVAQAASAARDRAQPPHPSDLMLDGFATLMTAGSPRRRRYCGERCAPSPARSCRWRMDCAGAGSPCRRPSRCGMRRTGRPLPLPRFTSPVTWARWLDCRSTSTIFADLPPGPGTLRGAPRWSRRQKWLPRRQEPASVRTGR